MKSINQLTSEVYNKISAGEVVENPSSVVKELIENSIDAGASEISISISKGGKNLIEIKDNGIGISSEDIETAFLPHATSKIKNSKDLENILTLGFRGEALASVSAVSIIEVYSKHIAEDIGSYLKLVGGKKEKKEPTVINGGTTIKVENLFYNTPARLKFLKKDKAEEAEITNMVKKLALSNCKISFTYKIDGKIILQTNGDGLLNSVYSIYGKDVIKEILSVESTYYSYKIKGYISTPKLTKSTKIYGTIIINGRIINNITISSAIMNAYGNLLMKRNFPIYVLELEIPTEDIDVNVTPSKTDVRFANSNRVYSLVYYAVKNVLSEKVENYNFSTVLKESSTNKSEIVENIADISTINTNLELFTSNSSNNIDKSINSFLQEEIININKLYIDNTNNSSPAEDINMTNEIYAMDVNNIYAMDVNKALTENIAVQNIIDFDFKEAYKQGSLIQSETKIFSNIDNSLKSSLSNVNKTANFITKKGLTNNVEYLTNKNLDNSGNDFSKNYFNDNITGDTSEHSGNYVINEEIPYKSAHSQDVIKSTVNLYDNSCKNLCADKQTNKIDLLKKENNMIENELIYKNFQDKILFDDDISLKDLTLYGQIFNTYLAIGYLNEVFLIDQHAYHERILFDKIVDSFDLKNLKCQDLLVTKKIEITSSEFEKMEELQSILAEIGFDYIINEDKCYIEILKMPTIFNEIKIEELIDGILAIDNVTKNDLLPIFKEQFAQQACKKAIKGGDKLSEYQISWIMNQFKNKNILLCPHGRPIVVKVEKKDIDKIFKRIV